MDSEPNAQRITCKQITRGDSDRDSCEHPREQPRGVGERLLHNRGIGEEEVAEPWELFFRETAAGGLHR